MKTLTTVYKHSKIFTMSPLLNLVKNEAKFPFVGDPHWVFSKNWQCYRKSAKCVSKDLCYTMYKIRGV